MAAHFEECCFRLGAPARAEYDAFEDTHGRLVRAGCSPAPRRRAWKPSAAGLGYAVLAVESIHSVHGTGKVESEIRYFPSSCRDDPAVLGAAIPAHWSIENAVHWVLDAILFS